MALQPTWFSKEQYYDSKMVQLKAMGYTTTRAELVTAIEAMGGAWVHYERHGTKETYITSNMQAAYIPLKDDAGDVVFDPQAYCESKLAQLNSLGSEYQGQFSTWQQVAVAINATGQSLYQHYFNHGQYEGLNLNENFSSLNFYRAKLDYLNAHSEEWGTWTLEGVMNYFREHGLDAYQNWRDFGAEEGIIPAMVSPNDSGTMIELTTGFDNLTGTSGNDFFMAYAFGDANSLNTGDRINGGGGIDTLYADLVGSDIALMPITNSVEIFKFQVQDEGRSGDADNNVGGYIDAQRIAGSNTVKTQFWSASSRDDLAIEDVRIDSNKVVVGMQNTDPGEVDYTFFFDPQHLKADSATTSGNLVLELIDSQGALADAPLRDNPFNKVIFHYNGQQYTVEFERVDGTSDYEDLRDAIAEAISAIPGLAGVIVELGDQFTMIDSLTGIPVIGTQIILRSDDGAFTINGTAGDGWGATGAFPPDNSTSATMNQSSGTDCPLIKTDVALDNVARVQWDDESPCLPDNAIYGSRAGDLIIGSMATRGGIERFDVTVDRGSWLNSLSSTNNALRMITVNGKDWDDADSFAGTADKNGQLFIGAHRDEDDADSPSDDMFSWQEKARLLSHVDINAEVAGIWDVKYFDASTYTGDINIAAQFTAETYDKYLKYDDGQQLVANAPTGDFTYAFGSGNDTLNMLVLGGIAADRDFVLKMDMGAGNDLVNFNFDFNTGNQAIDQVDLENVSINTGSGEDTVWAWGKLDTADANSRVGRVNAGDTLDFHFNLSAATPTDQNDDFYDGIAGYLKVDAGAGNDAVYAAQDMTVLNSVWVLNANAPDPSNEDARGIYVDAVGEAQPLNNNVASTNNHSFPGAASTTYSLYADVTFLGITAKVLVGTYTTGAGASPSYSVTADALNKAVIRAIENDPTLSKLLVAKDGAGKSLLVMSLIDGAYDLSDFDVSYYHITGTDPAIPVTPTDYVQMATDVGGALVPWGTLVINTTTWTATPVALQTYIITVGAETITFTVGASPESWDDVVADLASQATANADFLFNVSSDIDGEILLTAKDAMPTATTPPVVDFGASTGGSPVAATPDWEDTYIAPWTGGDAIGSDLHYYGLTEVNGGADNDVLVTGYADALVNAGDGNDTVIVGNLTYNDITGGKGADTIVLGSYVDDPLSLYSGFGNNTVAPDAYDVLNQGIGDSGLVSGATINTAKTVLGTGTFDVVHNFDKVVSSINSDRIVLSSYAGTPEIAAATLAADYDALMAAAQNNAVRYARGIYNDVDGTFTFGGGTDMIVAYDADGSAAVSWEAVVLTGVGAAATVVSVGSTTATDYLTVAN